MKCENVGTLETLARHVEQQFLTTVRIKKLKNMEIEEFNKVETFDKTKKITDWEKQNTLDC